MNGQTFNLTSEDGIKLWGQDWPTEGAVKGTVCLVHGLGEHCSRYEHVAAALNTAGYAMVGIDQRGHGHSGGPRGHARSYNTLLDDVVLLLAEAKRRYPQAPLFLYGHSMGGNIALNYALRRSPVLAGAIITSPWLRLANPPTPTTVTLAKGLRRLWPNLTLANGLHLEYLSHDQVVVQNYRQDPLVHDRISAQMGMDLMEAGEWALAHAEDWQLPLLLMHGENDGIIAPSGSSQFAEKARNCRYRSWPGLYHELHNELQKQAVLAEFVNWLQEENAN